MIKGNLMNILHILYICKPIISSNFAVNYFRPVGDMGPWRPMKLVSFSGPTFIAMWLTIFHYKDYKVGYSATNKKNQRKNKGLFRRITINAKSISKYLRKNGENSKLRVLVQWVEKYPFLEISTKFGQKKSLNFSWFFFKLSLMTPDIPPWQQISRINYTSVFVCAKNMNGLLKSFF